MKKKILTKSFVMTKHGVEFIYTTFYKTKYEALHKNANHQQCQYNILILFSIFEKYVYNCITIVIDNFNVHTLTLTFESITLQTYMEQDH
jgi:hypothetical protein